MAEVADLTGDGGVLKTVVRKAKDDAIAPTDSLPLVDVHYEGTLAENGEVFDTTHEDNSIFSFEIGQGAVIKAWDIALRTMKKQRELAAATKEEEKKKREEAKAAAAARVQAKLDAKKGKGKGKGK
uniref:peptidylprolyl isomerase n=1 Tax=Oryza meridionalis TaxID=40149 RepID=A0A0E0DSG1_9ORYZ